MENTNLNHLYHIEVYMPKKLIERVNQLKKSIEDYRYSYHLRTQMEDENDKKHYIKDERDLVEALNRLEDEQYLPFEVETFENGGTFEVTKFVVRVPYDDERDITIVVAPRGNDIGFIKTAWLNYKTDVHSTLDESRYEKKPIDVK